VATVGFMFTTFAYLMIGLAGAGIIGGTAVTLWFSRSFFEAAMRQVSENEDGEASEQCASLCLEGITLCMPEIRSRKKLEKGCGTEKAKMIRRIHAPLSVVNWAFRGAVLSAFIDFVLGLVALSNSTIYRAMDTELIEGYQIGIVCGILGVTLCGLALFPLGYVWYSGVLSMTDTDDISKIGEQLRRSYSPAVLSALQAAALRHDKTKLEAFDDGVISELDASEKADGGVGMIEKDADDVIDMPQRASDNKSAGTGK